MAMGEDTISAACTDQMLVRRCLDGDTSGFDALYARYRRQLFAYLNRLLAGHQEHVEDLFQNVWLKVVRNLPRYTERQHFLAWLLRIAHNQTMDFYRRNRAVALESIPERQDARPTPPQAAQRAHLRQALEAAIGMLPPEQRRVVRLRQDGMAFRDIAECEGIALNTALGRMHYAVLKLRQALQDFL